MSSFTSIRQRNAGFTLIDAMIAVVVLATGILALTLLQTTMLRATAEARDRSEAATVAQNLVEGLRASANETVAGYQALNVAGTWDGADCDFANSLIADFAGGAEGEYRYCVDVKRYLDTSGEFKEVDVTGGSAPAYGGVVSEFKQIEVRVGWMKADGSWGTMTLGDAVSGIPLVNSKELENRELGGTALSDAAIVQYPGNFLADEDNFIPIAVGNDGTGQQIAATNPTPEVIGAGVAETSFQVYTYLSQTDAIQVQRQIDTKVVACTCTLQQAPADATTFGDFSLRPSYWDGRRYTAPAIVENQQNYTRGAAAGGESESEYCDICCRDHHDPSGFDYNGEDDQDPADDFPKFDVFAIDPDTGNRIANHRHYAGAQSPAVSAVGQSYDEVCRLIRVDGIYRVTPDPAVEHFAYVPTDNGTRDRTTESITTSYNGFVRDYVEDRLLPLSGYDGTDSMPVMASPPVDVSSLEDDYGLNAQAASAVTISSAEAEPVRYLQNRAVIMDALEYSAQKTIEAQLVSNTSCEADPLPCILAYVPFASINLTMLTNWTASPTGIFTINPQDVMDGDVVEAYAGQVGLVASPTGTGTNGNVLGSLSRTVTALVDRFELFPLAAEEQASWRHVDSQPFERTNAAPTGSKFKIVPAGLTYFSDKFFGADDAPDVRWISGTSQGLCIFSQTDKDFTCHVFDDALLANMTISITNYHGILEPTTNGNNADGINCPSSANKRDTPPAKCSIFASSGSAVVPAPIGYVGPTLAQSTSTPVPNPSDDEITIQLGTVLNDASYSITFSGGTAVVPGGTCNETTGVVTWNWSDCRSD